MSFFNNAVIIWTPSELNGRMIYHNHPNDSAFSREDLITTASTGARGIVASGKSGDYIFRKTGKFDAVGFQKAISQAKTVDADYNKGVDRWLRRNARKYGYSYEFRRA